MANHSFDAPCKDWGSTTSTFNLSQDQLRRINKVVLSGQLATGMVHDFNHVLNIIRGYSELLLGDQMQSDATREKLLQIRKSVDRGASLAQQLLAFSRSELNAPVALDINRQLQDLEGIIGPLVAGHIELRMLLGGDVCPVRFNLGQFQQVLINLLINARDAMPNGGQLTIKTGRAKLNDGWPGQQSRSSQHDYVSVEVTDTGCGMDPETQSRIFEPFFTTKEATGGSGLGLANVREILTRSGGQIRVQSTPGRGSTFVIFLPCFRASSQHETVVQ
jgi:two-component system cell cycle sensor histidine kinase/response regulator CckA